jgi:hypothetical protein
MLQSHCIGTVAVEEHLTSSRLHPGTTAIADADENTLGTSGELQSTHRALPAEYRCGRNRADGQVEGRLSRMRAACPSLLPCLQRPYSTCRACARTWTHSLLLPPSLRTTNIQLFQSRHDTRCIISRRGESSLSPDHLMNARHSIIRLDAFTPQAVDRAPELRSKCR